MSAASSPSPVTGVLLRALRIARTSGAGAAGVVHLVAALAEDDVTVAARALRAGGLDRDRLAGLVARQGSETPAPQGVTDTPHTREILGVARGIALGTGADEDPAHVLLALLHDPSEEPGSLWPLVGLDPARVRDHLAASGVAVPPAPLPVPRVRRERRTVTFPAADRQSVTRAMVEAYPPGSTLWWGWNLLDDGRCYVSFEDPDRTAEVLAVIGAAATHPVEIDVPPADRR